MTGVGSFVHEGLFLTLRGFITSAPPLLVLPSGQFVVPFYASFPSAYICGFLYSITVSRLFTDDYQVAHLLCVIHGVS